MITAKIVCDSISQACKRITTFELEYPRFIHSEVLTHRALSKNSASSRAIPVSVTIKSILDDPAMPVHWGKNQAGMSAKEEVDDATKHTCKWLWLEARDQAIASVKQLVELGLHKQIANRILEPWVHMKVVATATDWDNFFHLRLHQDAQPEIHELAKEMWKARLASTPKVLDKGEWHLPYVDDSYTIIPDGIVAEGDLELHLEDAIKLSASLCAQISYRKSDESIEKALSIYERLVGSVPKHSSPFEHQAEPMYNPDIPSGNFRGWTQYRQLIPRNVCKHFTGGLPG